MNTEFYGKRTIKRVVTALGLIPNSAPSTQYWTEHNVTNHRQFKSVAESLTYFHWRNDQYYRYIDLMPVSGQDGKVVLDFGCGPGNDLVGFSEYSKPAQLVGADVSSSSLAEAKERLKLHRADVRFLQLEERSAKIPLDSESVDHVHSSGVLHHTPDPLAILKEFSRVLKPGGTVNLMVYHSDSLWVHLYVAYQKMLLEEAAFAGLSLEQAFTKTTDGPNCPISRFYRPDEFQSLCREAGLKVEFQGAAISIHEMTLLPKRFDAIQDVRLNTDSRKFLLGLEFDSKGYPFSGKYLAGIDGCFSGSKI